MTLKPKAKQKYVVWSYDESEWQTFEDVVLASSAERAAKRVEKARPYATLDAYVQPMPLKDYIVHLQRELDSALMIPSR